MSSYDGAVSRPRPEPPYLMVAITVERTDVDDGYAEAADRMLELAEANPGFLGMEFVQDLPNRRGVTLSFWRTDEALREWREHVEHVLTMEQGRERWYARYHVWVARVEREYDWSRDVDSRP